MLTMYFDTLGLNLISSHLLHLEFFQKHVELLEHPGSISRTQSLRINYIMDLYYTQTAHMESCVHTVKLEYMEQGWVTTKSLMNLLLNALLQVQALN